ncbi:tetratricopeptide repeat protein [Fibrobacterota bacterium]
MIRANESPAMTLLGGAFILICLHWLCACGTGENSGIDGDFDDKDYLHAEIEKLSRAASKEPDNPRAYLGLAWAQLDDKEYHQAIKNFNLTLQKHPKMSVAYMGLGTAYQSLGQYQYAIDSYNQAIRHHPDWYFAYFQLGKIYKEKGNMEKALKYLDLLMVHDKNLANKLMNFLY